MHNFNAIQRSRQVTAVADDLNIASVNWLDAFNSIPIITQLFMLSYRSK